MIELKGDIVDFYNDIIFNTIDKKILDTDPIIAGGFPLYIYGFYNFHKSKNNNHDYYY